MRWISKFASACKANRHKVGQDSLHGVTEAVFRGTHHEIKIVLNTLLAVFRYAMNAPRTVTKASCTMQPKKHVPTPWYQDMDLLLGITNLVCAFLVLLAGLGYGMPPLFGGRSRHIHALIPGLLGILMGICTAFLPMEKFRKAAAHVLVLLSIGGVLGAVPGLMKLPSIYFGYPVEKKDAVWIQTWMFVICLPFTVFCIVWFVANKKAEKARAAKKE